MKKWNYFSAPSGHGTMICTACRKLIDKGLYRVRETEEAYLCQHKGCSPDDPAWAELEHQAQAYLQATKVKLAAYEEFQVKWHEPELESVIEEMKQFISLQEGNHE